MACGEDADETPEIEVWLAVSRPAKDAAIESRARFSRDL